MKEEYIKFFGNDLGEKLYLIAKQLEKVDKLEKEIEEIKKKLNSSKELDYKNIGISFHKS